MSKTPETIELENALDARCRAKREYGSREITIGFAREGHGDEIVDYMSMDSTSVFRCYELKVSVSDLKTDNKKSFYGDYNYLVVSESLYAKHPAFDNYIPPYCGILSGPDLKVRRKAAKRRISEETRQMLKDSLIRTLYWKMVTYQDADRLTDYRGERKKQEEETEKLKAQLAESARKVWTYDDFEYFYRLNHQMPSFTIEAAAKRERHEYALRKENRFTDGKVCPHCGASVHPDDCYCAVCGTDLRRLV
jgi:hypothetical protein